MPQTGYTGNINYNNLQHAEIPNFSQMYMQVGTELTKRYWENRQAYSTNIANPLSKLNALDAAKPILKSRIDKYTNAFKEFEENGNWHEASGFIFNTSDEMITDDAIKGITNDYNNYMAFAIKLKESKWDATSQQGMEIEALTNYKPIYDEKNNIYSGNFVAPNIPEYIDGFQFNKDIIEIINKIPASSSDIEKFGYIGGMLNMNGQSFREAYLKQGFKIEELTSDKIKLVAQQLFFSKPEYAQQIAKQEEYRLRVAYSTKNSEGGYDLNIPMEELLNRSHNGTIDELWIKTTKSPITNLYLDYPDGSKIYYNENPNISNEDKIKINKAVKTFNREHNTDILAVLKGNFEPNEGLAQIGEKDLIEKGSLIQKTNFDEAYKEFLSTFGLKHNQDTQNKFIMSMLGEASANTIISRNISMLTNSFSYRKIKTSVDIIQNSNYSAALKHKNENGNSNDYQIIDVVSSNSNPTNVEEGIVNNNNTKRLLENNRNNITLNNKLLYGELFTRFGISDIKNLTRDHVDDFKLGDEINIDGIKNKISEYEKIASENGSDKSFIGYPLSIAKSNVETQLKDENLHRITQDDIDQLNTIVQLNAKIKELEDNKGNMIVEEYLDNSEFDKWFDENYSYSTNFFAIAGNLVVPVEKFNPLFKGDSADYLYNLARSNADDDVNGKNSGKFVSKVLSILNKYRDSNDLIKDIENGTINFDNEFIIQLGRLYKYSNDNITSLPNIWSSPINNAIENILSDDELNNVNRIFDKYSAYSSAPVIEENKTTKIFNDIVNDKNISKETINKLAIAMLYQGKTTEEVNNIMSHVSRKVEQYMEKEKAAGIKPVYTYTPIDATPDEFKLSASKFSSDIAKTQISNGNFTGYSYVDDTDKNRIKSVTDKPLPYKIVFGDFKDHKGLGNPKFDDIDDNTFIVEQVNTSYAPELIGGEWQQRVELVGFNKGLNVTSSKVFYRKVSNDIFIAMQNEAHISGVKNIAEISGNPYLTTDELIKKGFGNQLNSNRNIAMASIGRAETSDYNVNGLNLNYQNAINNIGKLNGNMEITMLTPHTFKGEIIKTPTTFVVQRIGVADKGQAFVSAMEVAGDKYGKPIKISQLQEKYRNYKDDGWIITYDDEGKCVIVTEGKDATLENAQKAQSMGLRHFYVPNVNKNLNDNDYALANPEIGSFPTINFEKDIKTGFVNPVDIDYKYSGSIGELFIKEAKKVLNKTNIITR